MSTSLLYHAFGIRDYRFLSTRYVRGGVISTIERKVETYCRAACGSENVGRQGVVVRRFRTVPIGSKRVDLEARIPLCGVTCTANSPTRCRRTCSRASAGCP